MTKILPPYRGLSGAEASAKEDPENVAMEAEGNGLAPRNAKAEMAKPMTMKQGMGAKLTRSSIVIATYARHK